MIIGEKRKVCAISERSPLATSSATHHQEISPTLTTQQLPPPLSCKPTTSQISPLSFVKLEQNSLFSSVSSTTPTSIPQLFAFHQQLMSASINSTPNNSTTTSSSAAQTTTPPPLSATSSTIPSSSPTTGNTAIIKEATNNNNSSAKNDSNSQQQQLQQQQNNNAKQQQGNTNVSPQAGGIIPVQQSPMPANGNKSPTQANNATTQHSPTSVASLQQTIQNNNITQMATVAQMHQSHQQQQQNNTHVAISPITHHHSSSGSGHSPIYAHQQLGEHHDHMHNNSAVQTTNIITLDADKDSSGSGTGDRFHHLQPHLAQTNPAAGQKQIQLQFHNSMGTNPQSNKKRRRFTKEEDDKIVEAVLKFKDNHKQVDWDKIVEWSKLDRTKEQIRNRYGRIKHQNQQHPTAVNCSTPAGSLSNSPSPSPQPSAASFAPTGGHFGVNSSHPSASSSTAKQIPNSSSKAPNFALPQQHHGVPSSSNPSLHVQTRKQVSSAGTQASAQTISAPYSKSYAPNALPPSPTSATFFNPAFPNPSDYQNEDLHEDQPAAKKQKLHHHPAQQQYSYATTQTGMGASFANPPALQLHRSPSLSELSNSKSSSGSKLIPKPDGIFRKDAACQTGEDMTVERISRLQEEVEDKNKLIKEYDRKLVEYERNLSDMQYALVEQQQKNDQLSSRFKDTLYDLIKERAERERRDDLKRVKENSLRIGSITYQRKGLEVFEVWQDGELFQELDRRLQKISSEKEVIERKKQQLDRQRQMLMEESEAQEAMDENGENLTPNTNSELYIDLVEQEEALKIRMAQLKKEEADIAEERQRLMIEKSRQVKELKRIRDEERSRFNNFTVLRERYLLMKLMGRGGFSEVYKAYDLKEMRIVACKIHQLNTNWKEQRKENYIKHVLRECQIHKSIVHPRVVQMFDTFIYDNNTYVTVLEFCDGSDLDLYIKTHQRIPEKEARNVIAQVFSGLHYLNSQNKKVIHFDLKPANILYCSGEIKITDFGLSKIMEEEDQIELTSQGAGTYWYLPPECFEVGKIPKISSKVDVWSAGVVFYQMLFGKKPFGNDLSQQKILSERTITNATDVQFPTKPVISEEAKEFIRKCLTYTQENRPDVHTMFRDSYLRPYIEKEKRIESKFFAAQTSTASSSGHSNVATNLNGTTMGASASSSGVQASYISKTLQVKKSVTSPPSSNSLLEQENVDEIE